MAASLQKTVYILLYSAQGKFMASKWIQSRTRERTETPTNTVCRLSPFYHHVWVGVLVLFLVNEVIYSYCFFLFCVNIFILMWSEPLDCKCVQVCVECTSDRNVSEQNYGWKPFLYTDSYFLFLVFFQFFFFLLWNLVALRPQLYMFCTFLFFLCVIFQLKATSSRSNTENPTPTTFRCQRLQSLSQTLPCQMSCT